MPVRRNRIIWVLALGAPFGAGAACSTPAQTGGGGAAACITNPFACAANETCWPDDMVTKFICIPTPTGKKVGDPCDFVGGQVVCGPAQICIVQGSGKGICVPYCDVAAGHTCPSLAACLSYSIMNPSGATFNVKACDATTIGMTGSTTSSSSTSAASTSTSSGG